ncbi:MAG TPA: cytochrome c biogenesis protein CcsA [Candidatus Paceibacterota bacterium]|nr:cytochrome c biogenesis protein CcsA [Candidatus Paceibacterota bacterium]
MNLRWLFCFVLLGITPAWALDLSPLESLAVQDGGRRKPLDTFARESLQKLAGRATWKDDTGRRWTGLEVLASLQWGQKDWQKELLLRCNYLPLKQTLQLPADRQFFSFQELTNNLALSRIIDDIAQRRAHTEAKVELNRLENEAETLYGKLEFFSALEKGTALRLIPPPPQSGSTWFSVSHAGRAHPDQAQTITNLYQAIGTAYRAGDDTALSQAAQQFQTQIRALSPSLYPPAKSLHLELLYNHSHPFRWAWIFYALSFLVMLFAIRESGVGRRFYWPAMGLFLIGFALQVYGFTLRSLISGRPPVTNMYEVVLWTGFGAVFFAFIFELIHRSRFLVLAASAVGVVSLVLADNLPNVLNPSIQPLVPVLRSNYWLTIHVLTITLGYAAFFLALGIGHIVMGYYVFKPAERRKTKELTHFNYRTMQIGVIFLTAGTILGGVWANYSWGRFWGWDPKETWALIALLCYLIVLHGRYSGWMGDFALNVASVLCFQAIVMAAYGVNYVLGKGLHSYGFGTGGEWAVACYVGAELVLVGLAVWRYKGLQASLTSAPPSGDATPA